MKNGSYKTYLHQFENGINRKFFDIKTSEMLNTFEKILQDDQYKTFHQSSAPASKANP